MPGCLLDLCLPFSCWVPLAQPKTNPWVATLEHCKVLPGQHGLICDPDQRLPTFIFLPSAASALAPFSRYHLLHPVPGLKGLWPNCYSILVPSQPFLPPGPQISAGESPCSTLIAPSVCFFMAFATTTGTSPSREVGLGDWLGSRKGTGTRTGSFLSWARNLFFLSLSPPVPGILYL